MTALFGAVADDFTGATDLAGVLARSGAPVSLRLGVPAAPDPDPAPFEIVALKIRTDPVAKAVAEAKAALDWLRAAGARKFFWKYCSTFDSTPEGNIGPVAEALMDALAAAQTIYCPAFPENGRSIYKGRLFVGDLPLDESPMKDHPLTPMRDSDLTRLLAPQTTRKVGLAQWLTVKDGPDALRARLDALASEGIAHVVIDAVQDADLETIARATAHLALLTGGSAVTKDLPRIYAEQGLLDLDAAPPAPPALGPGNIVLSGSCSAMTRRQVARYAANAASFRLDPQSLAADGAGEVEAWLKTQAPEAPKLIYATAEPEEVAAAQSALGRAKAGEVVENALARLAVQARDQGARRIVVAGGETSGAVAQALGVTRLKIGPEIAPGVPWCWAESAGQDIALALKSGNFGDEDFFAKALGMLP
jgi:uncharacterized protein YgbK (DUF1537 family)